MWQCDFTFELSWRGTPVAEATFRGQLVIMRMKGRQTILDGWCTRCMLYSVYAVLGVCNTRCPLMIMTWRDREEWLNFVFCDDCRVVDEKERYGGWRWEWWGGYERIWVIRGTTCRIGLGWPRIGVITGRIGTRTCYIGDGKLTRTWTYLKSPFLMMISPIPSHLSLSCPQFYHHLRTQS